MAVLSPDLAGQELVRCAVAWNERDARIYALGIGAGQLDPLEELQFTTENSQGVQQRVVPTFGAVLGAQVGTPRVLELLGAEVDLAKMLHAQQTYEQFTPLPTEATVHAVCRITDVWDKGSSTIVVYSTDLTDEHTGVLLGRSTQSVFFRGVGGWGGERGPSAPAKPIEGPISDEFEIVTRTDQPLLYRLSGDNNPLHSDPVMARGAGFERPIMHGMCVYGMVGKALLRELADDVPEKFKLLSARFSRPVYPGDRLKVSVTLREEGFDFVVVGSDGGLVLRDGRFELATASTTS